MTPFQASKQVNEKKVLNNLQDRPKNKNQNLS